MSDGGGGAGSEFDRIKPVERRLMERAAGPRLDSDDADAQGRAALFTAGPARDQQRERERAQRTPAGRRRAESPGGAGAEQGTGLAVHCSRCDATSALDAGTALRSALPLFLVVPWRDHPLFAVCPACRQRAWLRLVT